MKLSNSTVSTMSRLEDITYGDFCLSSVCAPLIIQFYSAENKVTFALKKFVKFFWFKNEDHEKLWRLIKKNNKTNLVSYATSRQSHKDLLKAYVSKIGIEDNYLLFNFKGKPKLTCNFFVFIKTVQFCVKNNIFRNFSLSTVCIFLALFEFLSNKKEIDYYFGDSKPILNYLCLNSAWSSENLYTHFFNSIGVKTFTFQHAAYCDFEHALPIELNNYSNIPSNYFLAWGEYTTNQISKYLSEDLKVLYIGNPIVERFFDSVQYNPEVFSKNVIMLALPRKFYVPEILDLIETLNSAFESQKYTYTVRLHPSMTKEDFLNLCGPDFSLVFNFDDESSIHRSMKINKPCAVISFNSSIIFELINFGEIIYIFDAKRNDFYIDQLQDFNSGTELFAKVGKPNNTHINKNYFFDDKDTVSLQKLLAF